MKTLLHNPVTHLFLKRLDEWTLDPNQAMSFRDIADAIKFQMSNHLGDAEVFLKLDNWDLNEPVSSVSALA